MKNNYKIKEVFCIIIGALLSSLALDLFLTPNKIASGGASGLGTVFYNAVGIPVAVTVFAVNVVLFVFGFKKMERKVIFRTLAATFIMSAFIQVFSFLKPITDNMLLAAVIGGVMLGVGSGLTIVGGASTGGTDFAAIMLNGILKHIPVANFILAIDLTVILFSGFVFKNTGLLLYSMVALYISTRFVDKVIDGFRYARLVYVISGKSSQIAQLLLNELNMGVTALYGKGLYSDKEQTILLCAVRRNDFPKFRKAVEQADKNAFIILTEANEVLGEGFK